ncbi:hypothetical protein BH11PLA2_BH11PLA2_43910 [soil metagenome]
MIATSTTGETFIAKMRIGVGRWQRIGTTYPTRQAADVALEDAIEQHKKYIGPVRHVDTVVTRA